MKISAHSKFLSVTVKSLKETLFEGNAVAVSSHNEKGTFDILPQHANFICLINRGVTVHQENHSDIRIPLESAVLKVRGDKVSILIDIKSTS